MFGAVGTSCASSSAAALEGRIRQDQIQLNDWTTCVSARTPKGQAAIQKLSGEISATKEQMARAMQTESTSTPMATSALDAQRGKAEASLSASAPGMAGSVDVWA